MTSLSDRIPIGLKFGYAVSDLGKNTFVILASVAIFVYMVSFLGVPPGWAGVLFAVSKIWDVITDPLIGRWSDQYESRYGRRRPFMFVGAFLMSAAVGLMFLAPFGADVSWQPKAAYFVGMLMLAYTGLTFISVPYGAMGAEMTQDYEERSNLISYRMTFAAFGTLIAFVLVPLLVDTFSAGDEPNLEGYRRTGLVLMPLLLLPTLITVWATGRAKRSIQPPQSFGLKQQIQIVFSSRPFLLIALTYLIQVAMITQIVASLAYIIFYIIGVGRDDVSGIQATMGGIMVVCAILSFPLWLWCLKFWDKKRLYFIGTLGFGAMVCLMYLVNEGDLIFLYINLIFLGFFYGPYNLFPWSMLPDVISHEQAKHGGSLEGLFNGWWTAFHKVGIAIGPAIIGLILQFSGFVEGTHDNPLPDQSPEAIAALKFSISLIPGLLFLSSLLLIRAYTLTKDDQVALGSR